MRIYTIGFVGKSARVFFETLEKAGIRRLIDVRLRNTSQLAGFAKKDDLIFFLERILQAEYYHELLLAPPEELLRAYQGKRCSWEEYEGRFLEILRERAIEKRISREFFEVPTVLLCSEASPERCHRRLVAEYLRQQWGGVEIVHL